MKKLLAMFLAFLLVCTLFVGCAAKETGENETTAPASANSETSKNVESSGEDEAKPTDEQAAMLSAEDLDRVPKANDKFKIGVSVCLRTEMFVTQEKTYAEIIDADPNLELLGSYDADFDVQKQMEHVSAFANLGADLIIISLINQDIAQEICDLAPGIPMVFTNRPPTDTSILDNPMYCYVGGDESYAGQLQGEFIVDALKKAGKTEANWVNLFGELGAPNATARSNGAKSVFENSEIEFNLISEQCTDWDRAKSVDAMQQILGLGKEIDVVVAGCDEQALGAVEALKMAGAFDGVLVTGIDGSLAGITSVKDGEMAQCVTQQPVEQAIAAMAAGLSYLNGQDMDAYYWIPFESITADNVQDYLD